MYSRRTLLWGILALIIAVEGVALLLRPGEPVISTRIESTAATTAQVASVEPAIEHSAAAPSSSGESDANDAEIPEQRPVSATLEATAPTQTVASPQGMAARVANPYATPPQSLADIHALTRAALVNVMCTSNGSIRPVSGSGVIIDPRGVIITNAHVAQYVLLAQSGAVDLSCTIRTGSPARAAWQAGVLYLPPVWVKEHVHEWNAGQTVTGTGEHDYALLYIASSANGAPLPDSFSYLPIDTREAIGFLGDEVVVAGYPAEFLGIAAQNSLYALSSPTTIKQLLTFGSGSVDLLSLGSVIEAQSGSSGGAITNPWGRLIGVITTTSAGATIDKRDLRGLTLSYINRDMTVQTGSSLEAFLSGNLAEKLANFNTNLAPTMLQQYIARLQSTQQ